MLIKIEKVRRIGHVPDAPGMIRFLQKLSPDVVILDVNVSGGAGIEVLASIKQERPATIVVVLTSCVHFEDRQKRFEAGADFFVDKPTQFTEVPKLLNRVARGAWE